MKTITIILFSILHFALFSQVDSLDLPLTYEKVVQVDSISSEELFNRAKMWFVTTYKDSKSVIQSEDSANGIIVGKAIFTYSSVMLMSSSLSRGSVSYTITIMAKEGRYKYVITDFIHSSYKGASGINFGLITYSEDCPFKPRFGETRGNNNNIWRDIKKNCVSTAINLDLSIIEGMQKQSPASSVNQNDW